MDRIRIIRPCYTPGIGAWEQGQIVALTKETQHLLDQGFAEKVVDRTIQRGKELHTEDEE